MNATTPRPADSARWDRPPIAYFSMEVALDPAVPTYAGGERDPRSNMADASALVGVDRSGFSGGKHFE